MTETLAADFSALLLQSEAVQRFGWGLLHSLWQIALLAGLYYLVRLAIPKRFLQLRYRFGFVILLAMLVVPVATAIVMPLPKVAVEKSVEFGVRSLESGESLELEQENNSTLHTSHSKLPTPSPLATSHWSLATITKHLWLLTLAWLVGVIFLSLRLAGGLLGVRRLRRSGRPLPTDEWDTLLTELRLRLGIGRKVQLLASRMIDSPVLIGLFRPVVLVPMSLLSGFTPEEVEAILVHELAHVRRHDYLANLVQLLIETLLFYHPLVWFVSRAVHEDREYLCDEFVVRRHGTSSVFYAKTLNHLENSRQTEGNNMKHIIYTPAAAARPLLNRIRRILGLKQESNRTWRGMVGLTLLILLMLAPLAIALLQEDNAANSGQLSVDSGQLSVASDQPVFSDLTMDSNENLATLSSQATSHFELVENTPNSGNSTPTNSNDFPIPSVENPPNSGNSTQDALLYPMTDSVENTPELGNFTTNSALYYPVLSAAKTPKPEEARSGLTFYNSGDVENTPNSGGTSADMVLQVYPITSADPQIVLSVVQNLLAGRPGVRVSFDNNNRRFVVQGNREDHEKVQEALDALQSQDSEPVTTKLYLIENALELFEMDEFFRYIGVGAQRDESNFHITPTKRNAVLVTGTEKEHEDMKKFMAEIDAIVESEEFKASREMNVAGKPQIKVFKIKYTQADLLMRMLDDLQIDPDTLFTADTPTNSLLLKATPETIKIVEELITQLDAEPVNRPGNPYGVPAQQGLAFSFNLPSTQPQPGAPSASPISPNGLPQQNPLTPQATPQPQPTQPGPNAPLAIPNPGYAPAPQPGAPSAFSNPTTTPPQPEVRRFVGEAVPSSSSIQPIPSAAPRLPGANQLSPTPPVAVPQPGMHPTPPVPPHKPGEHPAPPAHKPGVHPTPPAPGPMVTITRKVMEVTPEGVAIEREVTEEVSVESLREGGHRVLPPGVHPTPPAAAPQPPVAVPQPVQPQSSTISPMVVQPEARFQYMGGQPAQPGVVPNIPTISSINMMPQGGSGFAVVVNDPTSGMVLRRFAPKEIDGQTVYSFVDEPMPPSQPTQQQLTGTLLSGTISVQEAQPATDAPAVPLPASESAEEVEEPKPEPTPSAVRQ